MSKLANSHPAFGSPGIEPRWTRSDKDGVGTAYSASSLVWWTVSAGILNEVYFPTIDRPQIRDLQFMVTDGETFCHDERRHTLTSTERLCGDSLGYRIVNEDDQGRYRDISPDEFHDARVQFTFFWPEASRWEGRDYRVQLS